MLGKRKITENKFHNVLHIFKNTKYITEHISASKLKILCVLILENLSINYAQSDLLVPDFTASNCRCGGRSIWEDLTDFFSWISVA